MNTPNRVSLSNVLVCMAHQLKQDHPSLFALVGAPANDGTPVSCYDVLSAWTGQEFDVCWEAVDRADQIGLVESDEVLTLKGSDLIDSFHLDVLDVCRRAAEFQSTAERDAIISAVESCESTVKKVGKSPGPSEIDEDISLSDDDNDDILDDDEPSLLVSRRPSLR